MDVTEKIQEFLKELEDQGYEVEKLNIQPDKFDTFEDFVKSLVWDATNYVGENPEGLNFNLEGAVEELKKYKYLIDLYNYDGLLEEIERWRELKMEQNFNGEYYDLDTHFCVEIIPQLSLMLAILGLLHDYDYDLK